MAHISSRSIVYERYGKPNEVLSLSETKVNQELGANEVLVKWLASPINPLDLLKIQGLYPIKTDFPVIGGSEGAGVVEKIGQNVHDLKPGDSIIAVGKGIQYWTEYGVYNADSLVKIDKKIDLVSSATLAINPAVAYKMLTDFVDLKPGDVIIQNAANSGVGRCVVQIAKAFGLISINLIRNRPNVDDLKNELQQLGANYVLTEEEFNENPDFLKSLDKPIKLALNGVGGKSSVTVSNALGLGGTMVVYGGMSKQNHEITTPSLLFKNIRVVGISITVFLSTADKRAVQELYDHVQKLILDGHLKPTPVEVHKMENYMEAINKTLDGKHGKQLLLLHPEASL